MKEKTYKLKKLVGNRCNWVSILSILKADYTCFLPIYFSLRIEDSQNIRKYKDDRYIKNCRRIIYTRPQSPSFGQDNVEP